MADPSMRRNDEPVSPLFAGAGPGKGEALAKDAGAARVKPATSTVGGPARSHELDPDTSRKAAASLEGQGVTRERRRMILQFVSRNPRWTAPEIGEHFGFGQHEANRRLSDLKKHHLVATGHARVCKVKQTKQTFGEWWITDAGRAALQTIGAPSDVA